VRNSAGLRKRLLAFRHAITGHTVSAACQSALADVVSSTWRIKDFYYRYYRPESTARYDGVLEIWMQ
jgi:hypothetical protein